MTALLCEGTIGAVRAAAVACAVAACLAAGSVARAQDDEHEGEGSEDIAAWETSVEPEEEDASDAWSSFGDADLPLLDENGVEIVETASFEGIEPMACLASVPWCDGPRAVPDPVGEPDRLASRLGLGTRNAAGLLLTRAPRGSWVAAAPGGPLGSLLYPVRNGHMGRGVGAGRRRQHAGVDIGAPPGTPIRAAADGLVAYSDNGLRGYGNVIILVHRGGWVTLYAHCERTLVFAGQRVRRGETIGHVGSTGLARGPHLHFELRREGVPHDPQPLFVGWRQSPYRSAQ